MEVGASLVAFGQRALGVEADPHQFRDRIFQILAAPRTEGLDLRQIDRQVMVAETQYPRLLVSGGIVNEHPIGEAQDDGIRVIGRQKLSVFGGDRDGLALPVLRAYEHPAQFRPIVPAFLDAKGHPIAQTGKFANLDRSAQRAGP